MHVALVQGFAGNFYGTTDEGGSTKCTFGCGTVFRITPAGVLTTLHQFSGADGRGPEAGLVLMKQGISQTDGATPIGGLLQATDGAFYGTAAYSGENNWGSIFRLSMGLPPFVKTLPTSGNVGDEIKILGTDLTGATSVTFGGVGAVLTVISATLISAIVPAGAATGDVQVVTPTGRS